MVFEWDPAKNDLNVMKHGIAFEDATVVFQGRTVEREDTRRDYGEPRSLAVGRMQDYVIVVVYTARRGRRRIISARLATRNERRMYAEGE